MFAVFGVIVIHWLRVRLCSIYILPLLVHRKFVKHDPWISLFSAIKFTHANYSFFFLRFPLHQVHYPIFWTNFWSWSLICWRNSMLLFSLPFSLCRLNYKHLQRNLLSIELRLVSFFFFFCLNLFLRCF